MEMIPGVGTRGKNPAEQVQGKADFLPREWIPMGDWGEGFNSFEIPGNFKGI